MKKIELSSINNILRIDPFFLKEGIEYAFKNSIDKISLFPLNHIVDEDVDYPTNLVFNLDSSWLINAKFIKELYFSDHVKIKENKICDLYELANLKLLSFEDESFKIDFSKMPNIEILHFKYNKGISNLEGLKKLIELLIFSFNEPNLKLLMGLDNLEILRLTRGNFTSLNGIENLIKLKRIDLAYAPKMQDAKQILFLQNLSILNIEKCKLLDDFSFLVGNKSIKELFVDNVKSLGFVPKMQKLKKINFWNCADGDMTPLLKSNSLEQVNFYPNKKNYSHTIEEIIRLTGLRRGERR